MKGESPISLQTIMPQKQNSNSTHNSPFEHLHQLMLSSMAFKTCILCLDCIFNGGRIAWRSREKQRQKFTREKIFFLAHLIEDSNVEVQSVYKIQNDLQFLFLCILPDVLYPIHSDLLVLPCLRMQFQASNFFTVNFTDSAPLCASCPPLPQVTKRPYVSLKILIGSKYRKVKQPISIYNSISIFTHLKGSSAFQRRNFRYIKTNFKQK